MTQKSTFIQIKLKIQLFQIHSAVWLLCASLSFLFLALSDTCLSGGAVAGIVIACFLVIVIIIVIIIVLLRQRNSTFPHPLSCVAA